MLIEYIFREYLNSHNSYAFFRLDTSCATISTGINPRLLWQWPFLHHLLLFVIFNLEVAFSPLFRELARFFPWLVNGRQKGSPAFVRINFKSFSRSNCVPNKNRAFRLFHGRVRNFFHRARLKIVDYFISKNGSFVLK